MMSRFRLLAVAVLVGVALMAGARPVVAQGGDSTLARVQRLVNAGNRSGARQLADSLLAAATEGTSEYAEALFARAYASSSAAEAERDYLRVSVEYPLSARAEDATMMVAQLKLARGDRIGARRNFERLVREHPTGGVAGKAAFWAGRLAVEDGDLGRGCASLAEARSRVSAEDVEQLNQIEYYLQRCTPSALAGAAARAKEESTAVAMPGRGGRDVQRPSAPGAGGVEGRDAGRAAPRDGVAPGAARPATEYSVQVAAFPKQRDAEALAAVLKQRGYDVRVWGEKAPFRVRVGRYATREAAAAAQGRMKASRVNGIVVEAEKK